MQQSGQPHLLPSLGKDLRTCEEQLSQLETHNEAIEVKFAPNYWNIYLFTIPLIMHYIFLIEKLYYNVRTKLILF